MWNPNAVTEYIVQGLSSSAYAETGRPMELHSKPQTSLNNDGYYRSRTSRNRSESKVGHFLLCITCSVAVATRVSGQKINMVVSLAPRVALALES